MLSSDQFNDNENAAAPNLSAKQAAKLRKAQAESGMAPKAWVLSLDPVNQGKARAALSLGEDLLGEDLPPLSSRGVQAGWLSNAIESTEDKFGIEFHNLGSRVGVTIPDTPVGEYNEKLGTDPADQDIGTSFLTRRAAEGTDERYPGNRQGRNLEQSLKARPYHHITGMRIHVGDHPEDADIVGPPRPQVQKIEWLGQRGDANRPGGGGRSGTATGVASGNLGRNLFVINNPENTVYDTDANAEMHVAPSPGSFHHTALANELVERGDIDHPDEMGKTYLFKENSTEIPPSGRHMRDLGYGEDVVLPRENTRFNALRKTISRQTTTPEKTVSPDVRRRSVNPSVGSTETGVEGDLEAEATYRDVNKIGNRGRSTHGYAQIVRNGEATGYFQNLNTGRSEYHPPKSALHNAFEALHGAHRIHEMSESFDPTGLTPNQQKEQAEAAKEAKRHYLPGGSGAHYDAGTDKLVLPGGKELERGDLAGVHIERWAKAAGLLPKT